MNLTSKMLSSSIRQLGKGQDFVTTGTTPNFDYIIACDGHGDDSCINELRDVEWATIILEEDPVAKLREWLQTTRMAYVFMSGSTLAIARIYKDYIELINVGDSQLMVIMDNAVAYISEPHDLSNAEEKERVTPLLQRTTMGIKLVVLSPTQIMAKRVPLAVFSQYTTQLTLASTQSLGHCNVTGLCPSIVKIPYDTQKIRVIVMSDGITDMLNVEHDLSDLCTLTAEELADKYERRWMQEWIVCEDKTATGEAKSTFGDYDDLLIGIWTNYII